MARTSKTKKPKLDEMAGADDPRAPLDAAALLAASRSLLARLEADLRERAEASPAVTRALKDQYERERKAERTAESFAAWSAGLATQVAAAWLLSCVFVRTLEDRGLLRQARLAGKGAMDSQRLFFQLAPSLTERDYLLMVWKELAQHPAARGLFDAEHSLVWRMSPSAGLAKELLALWRTPTAEAPAFRFGQASTRFLGDLYQDLSEEVRKRYALLQTPDFVEAFILDRTLEPAVERFGLNDTTVIDPTCGSGHFLLGAFDRLFEHRLRTEPGVDRRVAAVKALDAVYGADINPYAVAIARFRLTLSFVEKAGYGKIADAPALPLHVVVADSLRVNAQHAQSELWQQASAAGAGGAWIGEAFALEDEAAAREVLFRRFAAVVGNPPYITEKDPAKREVYRKMYVSAAGKYALSAPFCERFFQLARERGFTGQITANSFMKREFGKKLIEEYLPTVNLELIVNTSGAYIPGHGTPTVLLFGTNEGATGRDVLAVLAKRGEPSTPEDPAKGLVWTSVVEHWEQVGYEDDYLSVARVERDGLKKHPWSLGGGGAAELQELLEERAERTLGELADSIGIASFTLEDDVFLRPESAWLRSGCPRSRLRSMVVGEAVRDWTIDDMDAAFFPYDDTFAPIPANSPELRMLWPWRASLANSKLFGGKTKVQGGLSWYEYGRLTANRLRTPLTITFAFVATHNQFALDRGGKVFNRTAPIIKLPVDASEQDHITLLSYLNSSTACFWMKQAFFEKSSQNYVGDVRDKPERIHYEFASTGMEKLPVPSLSPRCTTLGSALAKLAVKRDMVAPSLLINQARTLQDALTALPFGQHDYASLLRQMVVLQEEIDWEIYAAVGLCDPSLLAHARGLELDGMGSTPADRPYCGGTPDDPKLASLWTARAAATRASAELQLLEQPLFKRPWLGTQGVFHRDGWTYAALTGEAVHAWAGMKAEQAIQQMGSTSQSQRVLVDTFDLDALGAALAFAEVADEPVAYLRKFFAGEAVPYLAALRYTDSGIARYEEWCELWNALRSEDAGGPAPDTVPSKYGTKDFRDGVFYTLRGPLDVPKERFISYPGCESDEDAEPVYGWAGWDHLQRAQALATLYMNRKDREGWPTERLVPMLAGILELLPWVKQWHNEPSAEFDGLRMGDYFAQFLDGELRVHALTLADLRAWRPTRKTRGKAAKPTAAEPDVSAETLKPRRARGTKSAKARREDP